MMTEPEALELAVKVGCDEREISAFKYIQSKKNEARLSADYAAELFQLFLLGRTCEEIRKINPGLSLGHIVRERLFGEWDKLVEEYRSTILDKVRQRAQDAQIETISLLADMLSVAAKRDRQKLATYMQTGKEADLGTLNIDSLKDLKDCLEMLMRATGQDSKKVNATVIHQHTGALPTPPVSKALTPQDADIILREIERSEEPPQLPPHQEE